jgi:hypothetical protein
MTTLGAVALLLSLPKSSAAQINLSADVWVDDDIDENGNFWMYGTGMARSDAGWVVVTTTLRDPSGGALDMAADLGTGTAWADVAYQLNVWSAGAGDYSTFATGED